MGAQDKQEATGSLIRRKYLWTKVSWNAVATLQLSLSLSVFFHCSLLIKRNVINCTNRIQTDIIKLRLICPTNCYSNSYRNSNFELFSAWLRNKWKHISNASAAKSGLGSDNNCWKSLPGHGSQLPTATPLAAYLPRLAPFWFGFKLCHVVLQWSSDFTVISCASCVAERGVALAAARHLLDALLINSHSRMRWLGCHAPHFRHCQPICGLINAFATNGNWICWTPMKFSLKKRKMQSIFALAKKYLLYWHKPKLKPN